MECLFKNQMFDASTQLIKWYQSTPVGQSNHMQAYFQTMHTLGDSPTFVVMTGCTFPFVSRQTGFYLCVTMSLGIFARCLMKLLFRDPRPYMINQLLYPNMCDTTYGTPDSEILLATLLIGTIWLIRNDMKPVALTRRQQIFQYAVWTLSLFFWLNMNLTGPLSGVSSVDQVLFGLNIGILLALFCNFVLKKPIERHVTKLMDGEFHVMGYTHLIRNWFFLLVFLVLFFLILYISLK